MRQRASNRTLDRDFIRLAASTSPETNTLYCGQHDAHSISEVEGTPDLLMTESQQLLLAKSGPSNVTVQVLKFALAVGGTDV